jgi:peroxiredoxin Q/BCP
VNSGRRRSQKIARLRTTLFNSKLMSERQSQHERQSEVDCGDAVDMTPSPSTTMSTELEIGDLAPDFKATAVGGIYGGGQEVELAEFAGSTLVLYFYPKDGTPGCTAQACDLRDSWRELQSKVELFGVSGDSVESHQKFIKKHGLPFPLLSDPDHEIVQAYQVWVEKSMVGKKNRGIERTTYLIGPDRRIKAILKKVKPAEHVTQLLKALAS